LKTRRITRLTWLMQSQSPREEQSQNGLLARRAKGCRAR
jgi:hypothetical protein